MRVPALLFLFLACSSASYSLSFEPKPSLKIFGKRFLESEQRYPIASLIQVSDSDFVMLYAIDADKLMIQRTTGLQFKTIWERTIELSFEKERLWGAWLFGGGVDVVLYFQTAFEDSDSAALRGMKFDLHSGAVRDSQWFVRSECNLGVSGFGWHTYPDVGHYYMVCSPDSSQLLFYRFDYSPYLKQNKPAIRLQSLILNKDLTKRLYDTADISLWPDLKEYTQDFSAPNDTMVINSSIPIVTIDNSGKVYIVKCEKPNRFLVIQRMPETKTELTLSESFDKINVTDPDSSFEAPMLVFDSKPQVVHLAAGCHKGDFPKIDGFCFATFDFASRTVPRKWYHAPSKEILHKYLEEEDDFSAYQVSTIIVSPNDDRISLICEAYKHKSISSLKKFVAPSHLFYTRSLFCFSVDPAGKPLWHSVLPKHSEGYLRISYNFQRLDNNTARLLYYDDRDNEGVYSSKIDFSTGIFTTPTILFELDGNSMVPRTQTYWRSGNAPIFFVNNGTGDEDKFLLATEIID